MIESTETAARLRHIETVSLNSDRPIIDQAQDRYGLAGDFIEALYRIAREWPGPDGVIVGLYGRWGIGKTSALNLFRKRLSQDTAEVTVDFDKTMASRYLKRGKWLFRTKSTLEQQSLRGTLVAEFNPWFYRSTEALIASFFGAVADAVSQDDGGRVLGDRMRDMGRFLARAASVVTVGGVNVDLGSFLEKGEAALQEVREETRHLLKAFGDAGGRLVVVVDDVDRLNRAELLDLFRVLRVVADLPAITAVVAMDYDRVADILNSADDDGYGSTYLEKIVQVDLRIPPPRRLDLQAQLDEVVGEVLGLAGLDRPEELRPARYSFAGNAFTLALDYIRTPRDIARYANSLRALLLAAAERDLHPVDATLVEVLHVFQPELYQAIQGRRSFLTGVEWVAPLWQEREEAAAARQAEYEELLEVVGESRDLRARAEKVLKWLFGDLSGRRQRKSGEERVREARDRRIASPDFFDTYFLSRPEADLPTKREVDMIVSALGVELGKEEPRVAEVIHEAFDSKEDAYVERFAMDLQFAFDALGLTDLTGLGQRLIDEVIPAHPELGAQLVTPLLISLGHFRDEKEWSWEGARQAVADLALRAADRLALPRAMDFVEAARIYRVIEDAGWASAACHWLTRVRDAIENTAEPFDGSLRDAEFGRLVAEARLVAGKLSGHCEVTREAVSTAVVALLLRNPLRLPEVLVCISISNEKGSFLESEIRSHREATASVEDLFGDRETAVDLLQRFYAAGGNDDTDYQGLVSALGELLDKG